MNWKRVYFGIKYVLIPKYKECLLNLFHFKPDINPFLLILNINMLISGRMGLGCTPKPARGQTKPYTASS